MVCVQQEHVTIDGAVAALDSALLLSRKLSVGSSSSSSSSNDVCDASAAVCAASWLLTQQQPALFGRAACEPYEYFILFIFLNA